MRGKGAMRGMRGMRGLCFALCTLHSALLTNAPHLCARPILPPSLQLL